jgi:spore maturation protein CgeB
MSKEYVLEDLQELVEKHKRLLAHIERELSANVVLRHDYRVRNDTILNIVQRIRNFDLQDMDDIPW